MKPSVSPKGWSVVEAVAQDGSSRSYSRVKKAGRTAILMDCSQGETPGHSLDDFVRIGKWLNEIGLKAPEIYERDSNYLIVEDFGNLTFRKALATEDAGELYGLAADVLAHLRSQTSIPELPDYYQSNVNKGHRRVIDWYAPTVTHQENSDNLVNEYLAAWAEITKNLPQCEDGFLHVDFHVENLMFLPGEQGLKRCGIIDFQGAMKGPAPYDLANLLEDVRVDVPELVRRTYADNEPKEFRAWYRVLGTQFHCRVIGQFIKMAAKDYKTGYLQYIPRAQGYIQSALQDPLMEPLKVFFDKNGISFTVAPDLKNIRSLVGPDAL